MSRSCYSADNCDASYDSNDEEWVYTCEVCHRDFTDEATDRDAVRCPMCIRAHRFVCLNCNRQFTSDDTYYDPQYCSYTCYANNYGEFAMDPETMVSTNATDADRVNWHTDETGRVTITMPDDDDETTQLATTASVDDAPANVHLHFVG
jgi:DNA-directed RNA polymerase subunit RPC12/RpoP